MPETPKYLDESLSFAERAKDLVSRMTLEEKLVQRLRQQAQSAAALGIPEPKRLFQAAERFGAAEALSGLFSRGRLSDCFDALADAGHLELSPEALVVSKEFGPLFSDEEADFCLQALLQAGFYG